MLITSLKFDLDLLLGISQTERKTPQTISIDFSLLYKTIPKTIHLEDSDEYICYQEIALKLYSKFQGKEIKLLEHLAHKIHSEIKCITKDKALVNVIIKKTCPYIVSNTLGKAKCEYKEF